MGLTKRLLYMDTRRGCWSKRSPTPWKNKNIFFRCMGGLFATIFPLGGLYATFFFLCGTSFIVWRPFCYLFFTWWLFCYVFLLVWGLFHNVGAFFANFFSMWGDCFVFKGYFMSLWFFYGLAPSPMIFFEGACYYVTFIPCPPRSLTAAR